MEEQQCFQLGDGIDVLHDECADAFGDFGAVHCYGDSREASEELSVRLSVAGTRWPV